LSTYLSCTRIFVAVVWCALDSVESGRYNLIKFTATMVRFLLRYDIAVHVVT